MDKKLYLVAIMVLALFLTFAGSIEGVGKKKDQDKVDSTCILAVGTSGWYECSKEPLQDNWHIALGEPTYFGLFGKTVYCHGDTSNVDQFFKMADVTITENITKDCPWDIGTQIQINWN